MSRASLTQRTLAGAGWLVAWRMVTRALGLISTLVLARLLVPADFGLVAMATTFAGAIDAMSQFGVEDVLIRRAEEDTRLHDVAFTIQAGRAVVTAGLIAMSAPAVAFWFGEPRLVAVLLVLAPLTALSGFENIGMVAFKRDLRFDIQFRLSLLPRLAQIAVTVAVAWTTQSYWALLAGMATVRLLRLGLTYVLHPYRPRLSLAGWRDLAGFSSWLWAISLARMVWDRFDPIVVGRKFGAASLGAYQVAALVAVLPISELVAPAAEVLLAGLSLAQRVGGRASQRALPLALALLLLLAPLAVTMSAGAGEVVQILLGPKWGGARPLVEVVAWACLLAPVGYVCRTALVVEGAVRQEFLVMAAVTAIKMVAIWEAAEMGGLVFVAGTNVACNAVETLLFAVQVGRIGGFGGWRALGGLVRILFGGVAAGVALRSSGLGWPAAGMTGAPGVPSAALHLAGIGVVAVAAYSGSIALLWLMAGRPQGPETLLTRVAGQSLQPCLAWVRGTA